MVPGFSPVTIWETPAVGWPVIWAAYPPSRPELTTAVFRTWLFQALRFGWVKSPSATSSGPVGPGVPAGAAGELLDEPAGALDDVPGELGVAPAWAVATGVPAPADGPAVPVAGLREGCLPGACEALPASAGIRLWAAAPSCGCDGPPAGLLPVGPDMTR